MMLFAIMLLANLLFFSFWITGLSEALAIKCAEMMPRVANCFCRCYLKNYNFRVLVASMGINLKTHPGIPLPVHPDHKTMDELSVLQKTSKFETTVPSGLTLPSKQPSKPVIDISLSYQDGSSDEEECKKVPTWQTPLVSMSDDSDSSDENYFQTVYRRSSSAVNVSHSEDLMMDDQ